MRLQKPKVLAILGYPLGHSLSPVMQQAALDYRNLPWYYVPLEMAPPQLGAALRGLRALENFAGANVTIPYKEAVIPFLDFLSPEAQATGAVNTIVVGEKGWKGYNTDIVGFLAPLRRRRFRLPGKSAVLWGTGGAARAVLYALGQEGVEYITIFGRNLLKARKLVTALKNFLGPAKTEILLFQDPRAAARIQKAHLLINATPLGSAADKENKKATSFYRPLLRGLSSKALVYDLSYTPPLTPLLKLAKNKGAAIINGQEMLVAQGAEAFRLWTHGAAPIKIMEKALKSALK
jgi:shikimate dehydrogenase